MPQSRAVARLAEDAVVGEAGATGGVAGEVGRATVLAWWTCSIRPS